MWVAEFEIDGEKALLGRLAKDLKLRILSYPLSSYKKNGNIYVYLIVFLFGEDKNKKEFIKTLSKKSRITTVQKSNNFIITQIVEHNSTSVVYNHKIFHVRPVEILPTAMENWMLASWDKKELTRVSKFMMNKYSGKLIRMINSPINDFSMFSLSPELTDKQNEAMRVAIDNGYYETPRRTSVEDLAKLIKVSYSTYQVHLRKAERKLIPFAFKKVV